MKNSPKCTLPLKVEDNLIQCVPRKGLGAADCAQTEGYIAIVYCK